MLFSREHALLACKLAKESVADDTQALRKEQSMPDAAVVKPLPTRTKLYYGLAEMPIQVASLAVMAYIPNFYGQDLGVNLAVLGTVMLLARLFDAVSDPLIGMLSDRTKSRWGRRRVWMVAAVPVFILAVSKLFFPPDTVDGAYLLQWLVLLWLGWTMLQIPYYAWGAELSSDYNERSELVAWRTAIGLIANVSSKLIPVVALYLFDFGGTAEVLAIIGVLLIALLPTTVGASVLRVAESKNLAAIAIPFRQGLRMMWRNQSFKILLAVFFLINMGTAFSTATILFFVRAVLGEESAGIVVLLAYYLSSLAGVPFWVRLSARTSKRKALTVGLLMYWLGAAYMFLGEGDLRLLIPMMIATGFCGSSLWVLPNSMKADVIDIDTLYSGQNRAAWFFSVWAMAIKLAQSLGPWLALVLLSLSGFDVNPLAENSDGELLVLRLLFSFGLPFFFSLAAVALIRYPIDQHMHAKIRAQLASQGR